MSAQLTGLWRPDMWSGGGGPAPVHYVELGPGRGTLARDALASARKHGLAPRVHFVEGSSALKALQLAAVPEAEWHHDLSSVPRNGPILLVANEFLDALPVRQLVRTEHGWRETLVDCREGRFLPIAGFMPMDAAVPEERREAQIGTVLETSPAMASVVYEVAGRLAEQQGAALFIDYGHDAPRTGSTLQAVRAHAKVDPFDEPGEADLTTHVDFAALAAAAQARGCRWLGTVQQGRWLRELGIEARADGLAAAAPDQAEAIEGQKQRLIGEDQMGALFKVMGLAGPDWPDGAGF
jgi:NADH dehydrogenase [ubiquinone] 1 alpha subcomplex assembly factor 7